MTYNFFIYIIVASTLLACKTIPVNEQVLHPVLKTGLYEYNLKGPVKTAKEYGKYTSKNLSKEKRAFYSASNFVNIFLRTSYSTFDKNKMRTVRQSLNGSFDSVYSDTIQRDRLKTYIYIYDINDFEKKKKYIKLENTVSSFIYNPLHIKLNTNSAQGYNLKVKKDSSAFEVGSGYDYVLDEKSKILEEKKIFFIDDNRDGIIDKKDMEYVASYIYDEKNRLVKKKYNIVYKYPVSVTIDHDLEIPHSRGIHPIEEYRYDALGNLTAVYLYKTEEKESLLFLEEYTYNEKNRLIKLKRINRTDGTLVNKHVRVINELFFNEQGEVSKVVAYNNDDKTVYATRLYTYEGYDRYGNWTLCNKYLDGVLTEVPTSILYRRFEYYEE